MSERDGKDERGGSNVIVRCAECTHFRYFQNEKGHNSPHALGKCRVESWDGNRGQWPMFQHPCKNFLGVDR